MTTVIKSSSDLHNMLGQHASLGLQTARQVIEACMQESIKEYYKESPSGVNSAAPAVYQRTYELLNRLITTDVTRSGNTLSCEVKIDPSYQSYYYPDSNGYDGVSAAGPGLSAWRSETESHGSAVDHDREIWNQAVQSLGGQTGIMAILVSQLKKCGIHVRK